MTPLISMFALDARGTLTGDATTLGGESMPVTHLSELAQFLRLQMALNHDLLGSTRKLGDYIGVSQGTALRLLSSSRVPKEETLRLVAAAFEIPVTEVREMAERPSGEVAHFELPPEAEQLSLRERDLVLELVRTLLEARDCRRVAS